MQRVLLVDDDPDIRAIGVLALQAVGGLDVATATSGAEAMAAVRARRPDAILLDVMMPDMDGFETLARLRADPETSRIPVVFLTAKGGPDGADSYRERGACGVIPKPFDPMTLAERLRAIVAAC